MIRMPMAIALGVLLAIAPAAGARAGERTSSTAVAQSAMPSAAPDYLQGQATLSRYMATVDPIVTHKEGCDMAQGVDDQAKSGIVILDWGEPFVEGDHLGTSMFGKTNPFVTTAQIQTAVEGYLDGYAACNQPATGTLTLAVGTSNYGINVTTAHAAAWAEMVRALAAYAKMKGYANETVAAADDMETGWADPTTTRAWLDAFVAAAGDIALYDYGDAGGCSRVAYDATVACGSSRWTQADVAYVAGGAGPHVFAFPEIYNTSGASAKQWGWIGAGAADASKPLTYAAVMTQVGSCGTECTGLDLTPAQALQLLDAQLSSHAQTSPNAATLSSDITTAN